MNTYFSLEEERVQRFAIGNRLSRMSTERRIISGLSALRDVPYRSASEQREKRARNSAW